MNWRKIRGHRSALRREINLSKAGSVAPRTVTRGWVVISRKLALAIEADLSAHERNEGILTDPEYHDRVLRKLGKRTLREDLVESVKITHHSGKPIDRD